MLSGSVANGYDEIELLAEEPIQVFGLQSCRIDIEILLQYFTGDRMH